jgi:phosphatidylglycerophosphatase A
VTTGRLLATGLGLGYLRPASGTWGSLPPPVLVLALLAGSVSRLWVEAALVGLGVVFGWACLHWGHRAEKHFGRKDPRQVVADEIAGQSLALLALPWDMAGDDRAFRWNVGLALTGFVAFRVLDVLKPPPAGSLQRLPGGTGILVDDLVAGFYALVITQIAARWLLPMGV